MLLLLPSTNFCYFPTSLYFWRSHHIRLCHPEGPKWKTTRIVGVRFSGWVPILSEYWRGWGDGVLEKWIVWKHLLCADMSRLHCHWSLLEVPTAATFVLCRSAMTDVMLPLSAMMGILFHFNANAVCLLVFRLPYTGGLIWNFDSLVNDKMDQHRPWTANSIHVFLGLNKLLLFSKTIADS